MLAMLPKDLEALLSETEDSDLIREAIDAFQAPDTSANTRNKIELTLYGYKRAIRGESEALFSFSPEWEINRKTLCDFQKKCSQQMPAADCEIGRVKSPSEAIKSPLLSRLCSPTLIQDVYAITELVRTGFDRLESTLEIKKLLNLAHVEKKAAKLDDCVTNAAQRTIKSGPKMLLNVVQMRERGSILVDDPKISEQYDIYVSAIRLVDSVIGVLQQRSNESDKCIQALDSLENRWLFPKGREHILLKLLDFLGERDIILTHLQLIAIRKEQQFNAAVSKKQSTKSFNSEKYIEISTKEKNQILATFEDKPDNEPTYQQKQFLSQLVSAVRESSKTDLLMNETQIRHFEAEWTARLKAKPIPADDFKTNVKYYLEETVRGAVFIITRKNKETAILTPYLAEEKASKVVSATEISRKLGEILRQTIQGRRFIIERHRSKIAVLIPPPVREKELLTDEQLAKLALIDGLDFNTLQKLVSFLRAEVIRFEKEKESKQVAPAR